MPLPDQRPVPRKSDRKDNEILIKGLTCALIGLIILIAPYVKPEGGISQLLAQSTPVGWFALVLGLAFVVQFLVRRAKKR